jgi:flagellar M-ring protein FliF
MAVAMEDNVPAPSNSRSLVQFAKTPNGRNLLVMVAAAAVAAIAAGIWLWSDKPQYRVLFSNFSDRDGGDIVASLQQLNVPYKFAEGGGAILVPEDKVHDARLKLASQGLPKGGNVGFELMENQKLGVSQFLEQVNFQRALEGELAKSIQSVGAIQSARVHLALPKNSVFVREQQKPTASVLLNLHPGRGLDPQQVSAIVHLVASSVPNLPIKNVTVVDQSGNLLSEQPKSPGAKGLDATQLKYVQELQQSIVRRVESIITPILGENNVRAEATADVDFSTMEQAAEIYAPNQGQNPAAVRSQQSSEQQNTNTPQTGVPGALSNQPPAPATAPLTQTPNGAPVGPTATASTQRDNTVNYEVDKTVRYVQQPMGGIKRLTVAVVVNHKRVIDKAGKATYRPLTDVEKTELTNLVKEAMGFSQDRGDSVNVVNSPFHNLEQIIEPAVPLWKQPEMWELGKEAGRYLLIALALMFVYFKLIKPLLKQMTKKDEEKPAALEAPELDADGNPMLKEAEESDGSVVTLSDDSEAMGPAVGKYQLSLDQAKRLAIENPRVVANVIKEWVSE